MDDIKTVVTRNSLFSISGQLALKIVSFLFTVLVVRRLGDTGYGKYATVLAFVGIFSILSDLGVSPFAVREIAKDGTKTPSLFWNVLLLRLILSVVVMGLAVGAAVIMGYSQDMVAGIFIASLGFCLYAIQGPLDVILRAHERVDFSSVFAVTNQVIFVLVGTLMLLWEQGFIGLIIASFMGLIVISILSIVVIVRKFGWIPFAGDVKTWPALLKAGLPFGVMQLMVMITTRMDVLILSHFVGDAAVGQYSAVYNNLILTLILVSQGFSLALFPSLSKQFAKAPEKVPFVYHRAIKYMFIVSIPLAVGGTVLADDLVVFLYDQEFAQAIPVLRILVWGLPLMFLNSISTNLAKVTGREKYSARIATVGAVVNVTLNLLLVPTLGFLGSAIAKVFTAVANLLQNMIILKKEFAELNVSDCFVKPVLAALFMGACVLAGKSAIHWLLLVGLGGIVYGVLLFLSKAVGTTELRVLGTVIGKPKRLLDRSL
jgi:O-antigen/teichoic acid export membrane protein